MHQKCPQCGQIGSVAKVSAIVAGGTAYTKKSSYQVASSFSIQNGGISVSPSFNNTSTTTTNYTDLSSTLTFSPRGDTELRVFGFCLLALGIILSICSIIVVSLPGWLLLFGIIGIIWGIRMIIKSGEETTQDRQAKATWETLYYCFRDDIVYVPGVSGRCVPRTQMNSLLY